MPNITRCTKRISPHCVGCYEAGSEEQANEPERLCPACWAYEAQGFGDPGHTPTIAEALRHPAEFVAAMVETKTATVTRAGDGAMIEYRRGDCSVGLTLESRVVRPGVLPRDDRWYPVDAEGWVWLRRSHPQVMRFLLPELAHSNTLTPRG